MGKGNSWGTLSLLATPGDTKLKFGSTKTLVFTSRATLIHNMYERTNEGIDKKSEEDLNEEFSTSEPLIFL